MVPFVAHTVSDSLWGVILEFIVALEQSIDYFIANYALLLALLDAVFALLTAKQCLISEAINPCVSVIKFAR